MVRLPRPEMTRMSVMPARTASSTTYWMAGLSTTGSISFGDAFVAGRNLVPSPAAGITAFLTLATRLLPQTRRQFPRATKCTPRATHVYPPRRCRYHRHRHVDRRTGRPEGRAAGADARHALCDPRGRASGP